MSLTDIDCGNMSARKKLRCTCPCGYGFETFNSEDKAIAMVQAHFNKFHMDMLPFGITTTEARALLTSINDIDTSKGSTQSLYATDASSTFNGESMSSQGKVKGKKSQIVVH